ncbi:MAG: hypothetical protein DRQ10_03585 [Candidatus Hydrothermota bacterium]|nr:MAG: hypothetical protein DRQ10_03585 [Candidatus Hydrothermae bacterium]
MESAASVDCIKLTITMRPRWTLDPSKAYIAFITLEGFGWPVFAVFAVYLYALGYSPLAAGWLLTLWRIIQAVFTYFSGKLMDTISANYGFLAIHGTSVITLLMYSTGKPELIAAAIVMDGIAFAFSPAYRIYEHFAFTGPSKEKLYALMFAISEGVQMVLLVLVGLVFKFLSECGYGDVVLIKWLFRLTSLVSLGLALFAAFVMPKPPTGVSTESFRKFSLTMFKKLPTSLILIVIAEFLLTMAGVLGGLISSSNLLYREFKKPAYTVFFLEFFGSFASVIGSIFIKKVNIEAWHGVAIGISFFMFSTFLLWMRPSMVMLALYLAMTGLGATLQFSYARSIELEFVKEEWRGEYFGFRNMLDSLGGILAPVLAGFLITYFGSIMPFIVKGIMLIIVVLLYRVAALKRTKA